MAVHLENSERYPSLVMHPQWWVGAVFWFSVYPVLTFLIDLWDVSWEREGGWGSFVCSWQSINVWSNDVQLHWKCRGGKSWWCQWVYRRTLCIGTLMYVKRLPFECKGILPQVLITEINFPYTAHVLQNFTCLFCFFPNGFLWKQWKNVVVWCSRIFLFSAVNIFSRI